MDQIHYLAYDSSKDKSRVIDDREYQDEFVEVFILQRNNGASHKILVSFILKKDGKRCKKYSASFYDKSIDDIKADFLSKKYKEYNVPSAMTRRLNRLLTELRKKVYQKDYDNLIFHPCYDSDTLTYLTDLKNQSLLGKKVKHNEYNDNIIANTINKYISDFSNVIYKKLKK